MSSENLTRWTLTAIDLAIVSAEEKVRIANEAAMELLRKVNQEKNLTDVKELHEALLEVQRQSQALEAWGLLNNFVRKNAEQGTPPKEGEATQDEETSKDETPL